MDRKKSAGLTSPGKVGFFVALLLVVTALGVSYFITGSFGLQWSWVEFAGASPTQWSFHFGAFIDEMVPLIALVALLSFAAYVLVSGAVRRYQASVSSGSEYRDLLRSFKGADDFEDEDKLDELKKHPELREFVMGFKNRMAARERQLDEREKRHKDSGPRGGGGSKDSGGASLAHESSLLLNAIVESKNGMGESPGLTIPELKQIERAVREKLTRSLSDDGGASKRDAEAAAKRDAEARHELDNLKASVDTTLAAVRAAVASARRDAGSCVTGAREIESQLAALQQAVDALAAPAAASNGIAAALKRVDTVTESLGALSEETKRIAIAAALSASGGGGEGDAIKVAEDIRTIATRFNSIAQQWKEASPAIRNAIDTIATSAVGAEKRRAVVVKAIDDVVAKTRLWGERLVALAGAVDGLDRAAGSGKTAKAAPAPAPSSSRTSAPAPAPAPKSQEDWGNLAADLEESVSIPPAPEVPAAESAIPDLDSDFVTQSTASVFEETGENGDEAPFADIPGFEQDKHLFTDSAGRKTHHDHDNDPRFVVEREAGGEWDLERGTQAAEREAGHGDKRGKAAAHAAPAPASAEDDGFLTGPGPKAPADKPIKPSQPEKAKPAVAIPVKPDPDADAIDLYALGAIDAVIGVHA